MANFQKHTKGRKRRRWPWITLAVFLAIVILARLSLKTGPVQRWAHSQIMQASNELLTAELHIRQVRGDLWKEIELVDVTVANGDTVFSADTVYARYDLLSYFKPEFMIERVNINHPYLKVLQDRKGNWNLQQLVRKATSADTTSADPFFFNIADISVTRGRAESTIHSFSEDSALAVRELNMEAGFRYFEENFEIRLRELSFQIEDTRLSSPVSVQTAGRANRKQIDLEKLVIATGTSVLRSTANLDMNDSTARASISARPVSWRDVSAYLDKYPVNQDLQFSLGLAGNAENFEVSLTARAKNLQQVELKTGFSWHKNLVLRHAELTTQEVDLAAFFADSALPRFDSLRIKVSGDVNVARLKNANFTGDFLVRQIQQNRYQVDRLSGTFSVQNEQLQADATITRGKETAGARLAASEIWNETPSFAIDLAAQHIDPAYWTGDSTYYGNLNFAIKIEGTGYELSGRLWDYELNIKNSRITGQPFSLASFKGKLNGDRFTTQSTVRLQNSELHINAEVKNYLNEPEYHYNMRISRFNLAECRGLKDFSTSINGTLEGRGRYFDPKRMKLTSSLKIDSSVINGELVEEVSARLQVRDTVARVDSARVRSAIADGNFGGRFHLMKWYDIKNRIDLEMQVKDVQSLAPLGGVKNLQTQGEIKGSLSPLYGSNHQFNITVNLDDISYGESFAAKKIKGEIKALIGKDPEYVLNLDLTNPVIKSVVLQDFSLTTRGKVTSDSTYDGDFQLMFSSADDSRIQQFGSYSIGNDSVKIHTIDFQIISSLRKLELEQPFDIAIAEAAFHVDTLRLISDDGAYMELAVPYADSVTQHGYLEGHKLNMTVIQNTLLNEAYFEGILSGRIYLDRQDTVISSTGDFKVEGLGYKGVKLDSLKLEYILENDRFEGGLNIYDKKQRLAYGQLRVPFKLGDPEKFEQTFFNEPVDGSLEINEIAISRFKELLESAGITDTEGVFRFSGALKGKAGQPEIDASLELVNAVISGVALDSVTAAFGYAHNKRQMNLNATVVSLKQKAAEIKSEIPIFVDLKNFDLQLPEKNDSIRVEVTTNGFNLASLNDFVSRTEFREVEGRLDGRAVITGPVKNLKMDGEFIFRDGAVHIVEAGIKLDDIQSTVAFERNSIHLKRFRVKSGQGDFKAEGTMNFDELTPGDIALKMNARNLRIANTAEYNAVVNLDAQLGGTFLQPDLKGKLEFVSGFIYLQNFGEKSVEKIELDTTATEKPDSIALYDSLNLDMDVSFNRRFYVRNSRFLELEYELEGQLDLLKKPGQDLQLFGELTAVNGYALPLGKRFQLEEGMVAFAGDPANPNMNIRHLFEPIQTEKNIKIWYIIEGTVENPQFKYASDPPMELQNIISYTLFGQPFYALDSWKQIVASSGSNTGAADIAMDVLLDKVEALATQKLGIDVVQIDNTRTGSSGGTSIKTGWYLNPKVFFAIQNEITGTDPDTIFILEYLLKENLKLIITQGRDNQTGVDIRWDYDY